MVRLFVSNSLIYELPVQAVTPSGTTPGWAADIEFDNGLILAAGVIVTCNTNNDEAFKLTAISAGDF